MLSYLRVYRIWSRPNLSYKQKFLLTYKQIVKILNTISA